MRKINRRLQALNALADIRDYLREELRFNNIAEKQLPADIVEKFNLIAQRFGADSDWCKP